MQNQEPTPLTTPIQSAPSAEQFDIRTMPEAFFPKGPVAAPLPWGVIGVVGVLVLALVGVGVYILFFSEVGTTVSAPSSVDTGASQPSQPTTPPEQPQPADGTTVVLPPTDQPPEPPKPSTGTSISGPLFPQFGIRTEDSDFDNLTNEEEKALNTDPTVADTDRDGYSDGQEVENLYDPLAPSPAALEQSRSVQVYSSAKFGYRFLYPGVWSPPRPTNADELETMIATPIGGEFFEVIVQENTKKQSAFEWYTAQLPSGSDPKRLSGMSIENLDGVWGVDGKTIYFSINPAFGGSRDWIYGMTYNTGEAREVNYPMLFRMLIESFRVQPTATP